MHQQDASAHCRHQQAKQFLEGEGFRLGEVGDKLSVYEPAVHAKVARSWR